jgi:hypothetical protein
MVVTSNVMIGLFFNASVLPAIVAAIAIASLTLS